MTKLDWRRANDARKMREKLSTIGEDHLPNSDPLTADPPDRLPACKKSRKKNIRSKVVKAAKGPKIGVDGLTKTQRRKLREAKRNAVEKKQHKLFEQALSDPNSTLNKAAAKTRQRWEKVKMRLQKRR